MRTVYLDIGKSLMKEFDESGQMYLVQKGELKVFLTRQGKEVLLGKIGKGELVGEISFLDNKPRSANVTALTECELIEIPRDNFEAQLQAQPAWISGLIKTLANRLRDANAKIKV